MDEQQLENRLTRLKESLDYIGEDIEELKAILVTMVGDSMMRGDSEITGRTCKGAIE